MRTRDWRTIASALVLSVCLMISTASYAAAFPVKSTGVQAATAQQAEPSSDFDAGYADGKQACLDFGSSGWSTALPDSASYQQGYEKGFTDAGCHAP